jgi:nucleotide-binding universal stress UspA family protein
MPLEFKHLLVPVDFGESSQRALEVAIELAGKFGSRLTLVHVYEIPAYVYGGMTYATADLFAPIEDAARQQLDATVKDVQRRVTATKGMLRRGAAATGLLAAIDEVHPDLVVMGTHGRQGVSHLVLGSVAEKLVRMSPVPVLTMRTRGA